jgi:hypothetical protein
LNASDHTRRDANGGSESADQGITGDDHPRKPRGEFHSVGDTPSPGAGLTVDRLHYTCTIKDSNVLHEDFRYIYSGTDGLASLPLIGRRRSVQANMIALDADAKNLVYLPSAKGCELTEMRLTELWKSAQTGLPPEETAGLSILFDEIAPAAKFDTTTEELVKARAAVAKLKSRSQASAELRRFTGFAYQLLGAYVPYVVRPTDAGAGFVYIRHGVDLLQPSKAKADGGPGKRAGELSVREYLRFFLIGRTYFDVPLHLVAFSAPPWNRTDSLHVRIVLPEGLETEDGPSGLPEAAFAQTSIIDNSTHDSSSTYSYIAASEGEKVLQSCARISEGFEEVGKQFAEQSKSLRKGKGTLRDFAAFIGTTKKVIRLVGSAVQAKAPQLRVRARVSRGIGAIIGLLWVVVAVGYYTTLSGQLSATALIDLLSALLIVILALVVYAVEKPFLRWLIYAQAAASTAALMELPVLQWLSPHFIGALV